jgi:hypothetical protein
VLAAPLDYLVWTPSAARVADAFAAQAKKRKMRELQLWVGGTMSETSRLELQRQGWTVHELSEEQLLARRP